MITKNCFVRWLGIYTLFPTGTIVRDSHHRKFLTRRVYRKYTESTKFATLVVLKIWNNKHKYYLVPMILRFHGLSVFVPI